MSGPFFEQLLMEGPVLVNFLILSLALFLRLIVDVLDHILGEWINLREYGRYEVAARVLRVSLGLEIVHLFKLDLVSLLSNDLKALENILQV